MRGPSPAQLVKFHTSGYRGVVAITGGGTAAISNLLENGGGSASLLEAIVPYSTASCEKFLGFKPDKFVSEKTARQLAMRSFLLARELDPKTPVDKLYGVGATCSIYKGPDERPGRKHKAFLALQTGTKTIAREFDLDLSHHALPGKVETQTRPDQERAIANLIVCMLLEETIGGFFSPLSLNVRQVAYLDRICLVKSLSSDQISVFQQSVENPQKLAFCTSADADQIKLVFPGSFNPLHEAHKAVAAAAEKMTGAKLFYELSVTNVDKPPLDLLEIRQRVGQFEDNLILSNAATFSAKAKIFNNATFVVGIDTWRRLVNEKYYENHEDMISKLTEMRADYGASFLVFGRTLNGKFESLTDEEAKLWAPVLEVRPVPAEAFSFPECSSSKIRADLERENKT